MYGLATSGKCCLLQEDGRIKSRARSSLPPLQTRVRPISKWLQMAVFKDGNLSNVYAPQISIGSDSGNKPNSPEVCHSQKPRVCYFI